MILVFGRWFNYFFLKPVQCVHTHAQTHTNCFPIITVDLSLEYLMDLPSSEVNKSEWITGALFLAKPDPN